MQDKLFDNRFGFSVRENNPFMIFPYLQKVARENFAGEILDLSRGGPGFGYCPSEEARKTFGFIC